MKFEDYQLHDSQRGWFGRALYFEMLRRPDIMLFAGDLGFGLFDKVRDDFPDQYVCPGAAEQALLGAAIGATLDGKTTFVYSITSFLLYRGFEWIRNYVNHEEIPVLLVGSGLGDDYAHDGITHKTHDATRVLDLFPNIRTYFPALKSEIPDIVEKMIRERKPAFLCLRR